MKQMQNINEINNKLKTIIKDQMPFLEEEDLKCGENIFEIIGYDSLTVIELLTEIENVFKIDFDYSFDFKEYNTLELMSEYIYERIQSNDRDD